MASDGQSALSAPAPKRKASDTEPGSERAAKRGRSGYGKVIQVKVFEWPFLSGLQGPRQEAFNVHEDILFHHSAHIKAKVAKQSDRDTFVINHSHPDYFRCYLTWIYHGFFDLPMIGCRSLIDRGLRGDRWTDSLRQQTSDAKKLCYLLIFNETELKDDNFKAQIFTKLCECVSTSVEGWEFTCVSHIMELWAVAGSETWFGEWVNTWKPGGLSRAAIDARSAIMDAGLLAILDKKVPPITLTLHFAESVGAKIISLSRSSVLNRSSTIASMLNAKTTLILRAYSENLVNIWQATFNLDDTVHFDMPSLSPHAPGIDQRRQFCELFAMAEYLGDSKLQRSILVFFIQLSATRVDPFLTGSHFKAFNGLDQSSGLRRWFIDYFAASATPGNWHSYHCSTELKTDVMNRLFDRSVKPNVPTMSDLDKYCKAG